MFESVIFTDAKTNSVVTEAESSVSSQVSKQIWREAAATWMSGWLIIEGRCATFDTVNNCDWWWGRSLLSEHQHCRGCSAMAVDIIGGTDSFPSEKNVSMITAAFSVLP